MLTKQTGEIEQIHVKPMARVTPVTEGKDGEEYFFHVQSTQEGINKRYSADERSDAAKGRAKLIRLLKERDYIVLQ